MEGAFRLPFIVVRIMLGHSDEKTILKYYCFDTYTEIEKMNLMENALKISWIHCIQVGIYFKRCKKDVRKLFGDMHKSPQTRINAEFFRTKKHRPRSSISAKTVPLVRLQGFEPWTPWLRVRCSTNWAKDAYLIVCLSFFVFCFVRSSRHVVLYVMIWRKSTPFFNFFYFFLFYFLYLHLMQFYPAFFPFPTTNFWYGQPGC